MTTRCRDCGEMLSAEALPYCPARSRELNNLHVPCLHDGGVEHDEENHMDRCAQCGLALSRPTRKRVRP